MIVATLVYLALLAPQADEPGAKAQHPPQAGQAGQAGQAEQTGRAKKSEKAERSEPTQSKRDPRARKGREQAAKWWQGLTEAERREASDRWQRYREMPKESQAELRRRMELVKTETKLLLEELSAEERAKLDALPAAEKRRTVHEMVRKRMEVRHPDLAPDPRHPAQPDRLDLRGQPLHQRLDESGKAVDQRRRQRLEHELRAAVKDGWIGPRAARHILQLPPEHSNRELLRVRQWRLIEKFDHEGMWEKFKIDPEQRARLHAMDPEDFMRTMRQFRGKSEGGRHGGPPSDRHAEGRRGRPGEQKADGQRGRRGGKGEKDRPRPPKRG
jgi:hypothetical protein